MEHTRKTVLHTPRSVFGSEPHLSINSSSPVPPEQTNGGRLSAAPQYLYLTLKATCAQIKGTLSPSAWRHPELLASATTAVDGV